MFEKYLVDISSILALASLPQHFLALMELSRAANTYAVLDCPLCSQKTFLLVQRQELTLQRRTPLFLWYPLNLNDSSTRYTVRANIIPKLIRETNIHFGLCIMKNKPPEDELKSTELLNSLLSMIFLIGEGDKKGHVYWGDNWVPAVIIIKSTNTNVAVTRKLTSTANHRHRFPFIGIIHFLFSKNFMSVKFAKEAKDFLKVRIDLS